MSGTVQTSRGDCGGPELVLIAPGWRASAAPRGPFELPLDALETAVLERLSGGEDPATSWQQALLDELGLEPDPACSGDPPAGTVPAANAFTLDTGRPAPSGDILRADPIGLHADRDTALLQASEALDLAADEVESLIADLNRFVADDGLEFHAAAPSRWYLSGQGLPSRAAPPPEAVAFTRFDPAAAPGVDAGRPDAERRLKRLTSELEMLLHAHPVNLRRRGEGRSQVSGLYFWGAAAALRRRPEASPLASLGCDEPDAFVRMAAHAAGVEVSPAIAVGAAQAASMSGSLPAPSAESPTRLIVDLSLRGPWLRGDVDALREARARLIARHLEPALRAIDAGTLGGVRVRDSQREERLGPVERSRNGLGAPFGRLGSRLRALFGGGRGDRG